MKKIIIICSFLIAIFTLLISTKAEHNFIYTIVLDAGHGGVDGGATIFNIKESDLTLHFVFKIKEILEQNNYHVILTRKDEHSLCENEFIKREDMNKRVQIIHQSNACLMLSIHMNKFNMEKYRGAQVFYSNAHPYNMLLADTIQSNLKAYLKNTNRNIVCRNNIYLLNHVAIPCCIVECGFMSNPEELKLLQNEDYQYQFAFALLLGIDNFLLMR